MEDVMLTHLRAAFVMVALLTGLTGVVYPLVMTAFAQVALPTVANGSLITRNNIHVGSALIGQTFNSNGYFHGRPSAAGDKGYDAAASSGSNLGPLSKKLVERVEADVAILRAEGATRIAADAVTSSASGLDPHISTAYAQIQINRVAAARKVTAARIKSIVDAHAEAPFLGIIGEPRVNVLLLNLALDAAVPVGAD